MPQQEHQNSQGDSSPDSGSIITSFDELAKGLATGAVSRRKALRWMGGAFVGAALASVPGVAWADDRCSEGQTRCGDRCVNLQTNERHCGSCSNRCASNQTCCKGRCVNLQRNERHCGSCFHRCAEEQECVDGVCQGGGCPRGGTSPDNGQNLATCTFTYAGVNPCPAGSVCQPTAAQPESGTPTPGVCCPSGTCCTDPRLSATGLTSCGDPCLCAISAECTFVCARGDDESVCCLPGTPAGGCAGAGFIPCTSSTQCPQGTFCEDFLASPEGGRCTAFCGSTCP